MNKKAQSSCFRTCELRREVYKNQVIQIRQVRNNNTQSNRQFPSGATIDDDDDDGDYDVDTGARAAVPPNYLWNPPLFVSWIAPKTELGSCKA